MIKIKEEFCTQVVEKSHIMFQLTDKTTEYSLGNILDPCPISVFVAENEFFHRRSIKNLFLQGHRTLSPRLSNDETFIFPLIPVGEWRFDVVFRKKIDESDVVILSYSIFYEIKPKGAAEF